MSEQEKHTAPEYRVPALPHIRIGVGARIVAAAWFGFMALFPANAALREMQRESEHAVSAAQLVWTPVICALLAGYWLGGSILSERVQQPWQAVRRGIGVALLAYVLFVPAFFVFDVAMPHNAA